MRKWKRFRSKLILDTPHFKVRQDLVRLPHGELKNWTYWDSQDSAMVVGLTTAGQLVMIRQYRYLVGDEVVEFPSGGLKAGESAKVAAKREFEEESGYRCRTLVKLGSFYETYGQLNRKIHIFFAPAVRPGRRRLDRGRHGFEDIRTELVALDQAVSRAVNNEMVAFGSAVAVLLMKEKAARGEIVLNRRAGRNHH